MCACASFHSGSRRRTTRTGSAARSSRTAQRRSTRCSTSRASARPSSSAPTRTSSCSNSCVYRLWRRRHRSRVGCMLRITVNLITAACASAFPFALCVVVVSRNSSCCPHDSATCSLPSRRLIRLAVHAIACQARRPRGNSRACVSIACIDASRSRRFPCPLVRFEAIVK